MKPLIGVSACVSFAHDPKRSFNVAAEIHYIQLHYMDFVRVGGGVPVIIPLLRDPADAVGYAAGLDGLVLTGGGDLDPALYGQENTHSQGVVSERDRSEIGLLTAFREAGKPILGVCRGIQVMAAALGGTLYQDVPTQIEGVLPHQLDANNKEQFHPVRFVGESFLTKIMGSEERRVNSSHHQAVNAPPPGFRVVAIAPDGVVEAIEHETDLNLVGVQWHPERMGYDQDQVELAKWFVTRAQRP